MANWKELGEVPDSDDEDCWESQSLDDDKEPAACEDDCDIDLAGNDDQFFDIDDELPALSGDRDNQVFDDVAVQPTPTTRGSDVRILDLTHDHSSFEEQPAPTHSQREGNETDYHEASNLLIPHDKHGVEIPQLDAPRTAGETDEAGTIVDQAIVQDEVSDEVCIDHPEDIQQTVVELPAIDVQDDVPHSHSRNLRQRAPIQLHPYLLEQARYSKEVKSHGIKPLRIDSQTTSSDVDMTDDDLSSRPMPMTIHASDDNAAFVVPDQDTLALSTLHDVFSSPPRPLTSTIQPSQMSQEQRLQGTDSSDDEEFPAFKDLIATSHKPPSKNKLKRVKYGGANTHAKKKFKKLKPLTTTPRLVSALSTNYAPNSPPRTSPSSGDVHLAQSPASVPDPFSESDDEPDVPIELPTPATSVMKDVVDLASIDGDTSDSAPDNSESESDHVVQARRVGKKIRGVLPASWLRLDQRTTMQRPMHPSVQIRDERSLSPDATRRGIAVPMTARTSSAVESHHGLLPFLSDDESDGRECSIFPVLPGRPILDSTVASEFGYASETHDSIDAMTPSIAHSGKATVRRKSGKPKTGQSRLRQHTLDGILQQSRAGPGWTLPQVNKLASRKRKRTTAVKSSISRAGKGRSNTRQKRFVAPRLGILDVVPIREYHQSTADLAETPRPQPDFLRIAARNARKRKDLARQSPSRKFVQLATREDTIDAQERLRAWRLGTIAPRTDFDTESYKAHFTRPAPQSVCHNVTRVGHPSTATQNLSDLNPNQTVHMLQPSQTTISVDQGFQPAKPRRLLLRSDTIDNPQQGIPRPAQLETTDLAYGRNFHDSIFRTKLAALDKVYRKTEFGTTLQSKTLLAKFLHDDDPLIGEDPILRSIEHDEDSTELSARLQFEPSVYRSVDMQLPIRRKKAVPHRLDIDANKYRQPQQLILQYLDGYQEIDAAQSVDAVTGNRLAGLGDYGTIYTYDFDVLKLPREAFFHESTFIGSGQLQALLEMRTTDVEHNVVCELGEKRMDWWEWNNTVSTELGICIDSIIENMERISVSQSLSDLESSTRYTSFILRFVQKHVASGSQNTMPAMLTRLTEVLKELLVSSAQLVSLILTKLSSLSSSLAEFVTTQCCLALTLLLACRKYTMLQLVHPAETLVRSLFALGGQVLVSIGVEDVVKLCDDLQYLTFREKGIQTSQNVTHAWVVLMQLSDSSNIPRSGFWDIINTELLKLYSNYKSNARDLEQIWLFMFRLLPLMEFNNAGLIRESASNTLQHDNWSLVSVLSKTVFKIYSSGRRQAAGFNDYLRALMRRCYHLIDYWNWQRYTTGLLPFFDFFAADLKLQFLRHEVWNGQAAHVIQQLASKASLIIDSSDVFFHILLKTMALSLRKMAAADDKKAIAHFVVRLSPSHRREYPKEKTLQRDQLVSLQSHHDILCLLFFAVPVQARKPSFKVLKTLANPRRSHSQTILMNVQAWAILAGFVLRSRGEDPEHVWPATPALVEKGASFEPFATWQQETFLGLLELYHSADKEVKDQLNALPTIGRNNISEANLESVIRFNKTEAVNLLIANLENVKSLIKGCASMHLARIILNSPHIKASLDSAFRTIVISDRTGAKVVATALSVITAYILLLRTQIPSNASAVITSTFITTIAADVDSQDFGSDIFEENSPRLEFILDMNSIKEALVYLLQRCTRSSKVVDRDFVEMVVDCYATLIVEEVVCGLCDLKAFGMVDVAKDVNQSVAVADGVILNGDMAKRFLNGIGACEAVREEEDVEAAEGERDAST